MQLRRVVLLFALVLGLVAVVAALAPPPSDREDEPRTPPGGTADGRGPAAAPRTIRLSTATGRSPVRRVAAGTRLTLEVRVRTPADISIEGLGLRQSADPLAPARFELLAEPVGAHDVVLHPVQGEVRRVARLVFEERASVRLRRRAGPSGSS